MFSKIRETIGFGQKKYNCATCHESFATRLGLDEHKTSAHPDGIRANWEKTDDRHQ